eukprot:gene323-334_t
MTWDQILVGLEEAEKQTTTNVHPNVVENVVPNVTNVRTRIIVKLPEDARAEDYLWDENELYLEEPQETEILVPGTPERPEPYNYLETQGREDLEDLLEIPETRTGFEDQRGYFPHEEDEEEVQPTVNLHVSWDGLVSELQSDSDCETEMETDSNATELEDPDPFWDHMTVTTIEPAPVRIVANTVQFSSIDEFLQAETKHGFQFKFKSKGRYYQFTAVLGASSYTKVTFPIFYHTLQVNETPEGSDREPDLVLVPLTDESGTYSDATVDEANKVLRLNVMMANALRREVQGDFAPDDKLTPYDDLPLERIYIGNYKPKNSKTVFNLDNFLATTRPFALCPQFGMVKPVKEGDIENREFRIYVKLGLHGMTIATTPNWSDVVRQNNKIERKRKAVELETPPKTLRQQVEEYTRDQVASLVPESEIVSEVTTWISREFERANNPENPTL